MRHGVSGKKLGRVKSHIDALAKNQLASFFLGERITTTITKAKWLRPRAEKMLTLARRDGTPEEKLHTRRLVESRLGNPAAAEKLVTVLAPRFKDRAGGYTRILKLGKHRRGDNAELAVLQFIDFEFVPAEKKADAKKAKAKPDEHKHDGEETDKPKGDKKPRPPKGGPGGKGSPKPTTGSKAAPKRTKAQKSGGGS